MVFGALENFVENIIEVFNSKKYYTSEGKPVKIDIDSDVKLIKDNPIDSFDEIYYAEITVDQVPFIVFEKEQYTEQDILDEVFEIANTLELKEKEEEIEESLKTDKKDISVKNNYPALLVALDSEKDAELTYRTLIEVEESSDNPNREVIDLLKKILDDELEHIALLSAMSAKNTSEFVADDSQEEFDDIVEKI